MKHNEYKKLLQLSLFGELNSKEQTILKEHLLTCEECRNELEDQKNLLELISGKKESTVDDKVLSAARYQLRGALRSEQSNQNIFSSTIDTVSQFFTTPLKFAVASVAMLLIGIIIGSQLFNNNASEEIVVQNGNENRFASLEENISISNFRFIDSDASDGEVEFTFKASKPVHLKGKVNDPQVQSVLTYAMLNEQNPGSRFNSINAMDSYGNVAFDEDIKNALVTVVMTDNNSGVRREAIKLLNKSGYDELTKKAYLFVLLNDSSSAMRIEALNFLIDAAKNGHSLNPNDVNLVIQKTNNDNNDYIRIKSKTLLEEYN